MKMRNKPKDAVVFGINTGKNILHVVGLDAQGAPIQKVGFRRDTRLQFFERATRAIVGMEDCGGSQWLARKLIAMGIQPVYPDAVREAVRQVEQERRH